ncbi:MAG: hypothetical protein WDM89_19595 [Rhizomicrobium sp.]
MKRLGFAALAVIFALATVALASQAVLLMSTLAPVIKPLGHNGAIVLSMTTAILGGMFAVFAARARSKTKS